MDILGGIQIQIDSLWYNLVYQLAAIHWGMQRGFIMMGYTLELINRWLIEVAFSPLIDLTNDSLRVAVSLTFVIALLVLGLTYLLSALVRWRVVEARSAMLWYLAGILFFTIGPTFYREMNEFRLGVGQAFYLSVLNGLQSNSGAFASLSPVQTTDLGMLPPCDNLGVYLPGATGAATIDGLDVALAYLRADGPDVMGYAQPWYSPGCPPHFFHPLTGSYLSPVPMEWNFAGSYFAAANSPMNFAIMSAAERSASISLAMGSQGRLLTAWPLLLFGVIEQLVYALITLAQGITFISFAIAILFAFFKRTEIIAQSILQQWLELVIQTVIIALIQALVVALFLAGTTSGSGMVMFGIGLICLVFMLIVLVSSLKAVWNSFNRLFGAFGQAAGGSFITPGQAAGTLASAGMGAVGAVAGLGAGAMAGSLALQHGATPAQTAGLLLGGSQTMTQAARALAYLPGVRDTPLGEAAEQFSEGAATRRVAGQVPFVGRATGPLLGAALLSDRDPDHARYGAPGQVTSRPMLIPAVGEALAAWTVPRQARHKRDTGEDSADGSAFTPVEPRRLGQFTPLARVDSVASRQQRDERDEATHQPGEDIEPQRTAALQADRSSDASALEQAAARLEASAEALSRAASLYAVGQMTISGSQAVASVMGDVLRLSQNDPEPSSPLDHLQTGQRIAQALGVEPVADIPPVQTDLARLGLFPRQAQQLKLSPEQTEQVAWEISDSPESRLSEPSRQALTEQMRDQHSFSWDDARDAVRRLEQAAALLPSQISAYGRVAVPPPEEGNLP